LQLGKYGMNMNKSIKLKKIWSDLSFLILLAMLLGIVAGTFMGKEAAVFAPLGTLFMQLIKMLVVPLVFVSIITGAASLGATKSAGRIGFSSLAYMLGSTAIAVVIALIAAVWYQPGAGISLETIREFIPTTSVDLQAQNLDFWSVVLGLIPTNPIAALVDGNILQIIFFGLMLGMGISMIHSEGKTKLLSGMNTLLDALVWVMNKVMWVAPLGVFGLMAEATGTYGYDILLKVGNLLWLNVLLFVFMVLIFYPLTIYLFSKSKVGHFLKSMVKAQ
jgi:Na+/H+-dicarboxylate symporter